jgi:hypothetical protein
MPSPVCFLSGVGGTTEFAREWAAREPFREWVLYGKGEGKDEVDVLAGVFRRPRGSLRLDTLESKRIEPARKVLVSRSNQ